MRRALVALALLAWAPAAKAASAVELLREGVALRAKREDAAALAKFEQADALEPSGETKAQIALAEQALGRWVAAEEHLRVALADGKNPFVARYETALRGSLEAITKHTTTILLAGLPEGARVSVDGGEPEPLRPSYKLVGGLHRFRVRAPGYAETPRDVDCAGGLECREEVTLLPSRVTQVSPGGERQAPPSPAAPPSGAWMRPVGLGVAAVGLVGVGVGAVAHARRESIANGSRITSPCFAGSGCEEAVSAARTAEDVALVGYVAGGALLVAGAVLFAVSPSPAPRRASARCAPSLGGLACAGVF